MALGHQSPLGVNQVKPAIFYDSGVSDGHRLSLNQRERFNGRGKDRPDSRQWAPLD